MIFVLFLVEIFLISPQPHIMALLLAINIFLLGFIISIVGERPAIPGIADIVISIFFF